MRIISFIRKRQINSIKKSLGKCGKGTKLGFPFSATRLDTIFIDDYADILNHAEVINPMGKLFIGKFSTVSTHLSVITSNHSPIVGIPFSFSGTLHINEKVDDVVIGDDCWLGTRVTLLPGTNLGRGSVVGACTLCNKATPPYAVLVGCPAKIIGVKFTIEQILQHESSIYPPEERLTKDELKAIFDKYYRNVNILRTDPLNDKDHETVIQYMENCGFILPTESK